MPRTHAGKIVKQNSSSSSKTIIGSRHQLSEATHVLLRELSTQKLVTTEVSLLSRATKVKPLASGRNISFNDGNGKGQKQGEIILVGKLFFCFCHCFFILSGTYSEVLIEINNQAGINNLTESPQKQQQQQQQDNSFEQNLNDKRESAPNSSILLNGVEPSLTRLSSPLQSPISQHYAVPLSSPTSSAALTTATVTSNSLS